MTGYDYFAVPVAVLEDDDEELYQTEDYGDPEEEKEQYVDYPESGSAAVELVYPETAEEEAEQCVYDLADLLSVAVFVFGRIVAWDLLLIGIVGIEEGSAFGAEDIAGPLFGTASGAEHGCSSDDWYKQIVLSSESIKMQILFNR